MGDIVIEPNLELPPQTCRGPCDHLPPGQYGIMILVGIAVQLPFE